MACGLGVIRGDFSELGGFLLVVVSSIAGMDTTVTSMLSHSNKQRREELGLSVPTLFKTWHLKI